MTTRPDDGGSEVVRLPQRTPFTMVDNPIIRAMTDYVALGLYLDMLSYPAGWRINIRELARTHKQGRQVLTDAMNDLIQKGLVFRVRYQEGGGQWRTRTYVCSSPVTIAELREVQDQYLQRCMIETSAELATLLRPVELSTGSAAPDRPRSGPTDAELAVAVNPLVAPSARFPAPGEPASGQPTVGNLAPKRSEVRRKKPPPSSKSTTRIQQKTLDRKEEEDKRPASEVDSASWTTAEHSTEIDSDVEQLANALAKAWPLLGRRDLQQLRPLLGQALREMPASELTVHLTSNTGGALHPSSLLKARLQNLPPQQTRHHSRPWCGQCTSESYRWLQDQDGLPLRPCPNCSPQAQRADLSF